MADTRPYVMPSVPAERCLRFDTETLLFAKVARGTQNRQMRLWARMLIAFGTIASANAQTNTAPHSYLPVPTKVPEAIAGSAGFAEDGADIAASIRASIPMPISEEVPLATGFALSPDGPATAGDYSPIPAPVLPESLAPPPQSAPSSTVTVTVEGVKSAVGTVYVAICDKGLSREGCSYKAQVAAELGSVEVTLSDIPPGQYAVVGFHDKNGNGEFDKFLGMPREPYALSGRAGDEFVPRFDDALVTLADGDNAVTIALKTPLGR